MPMKVHTVPFLVLVCSLASCTERRRSYESAFPDEIMIDFPHGHPVSEVESMRSQMDKYLRDRRIGFFSGVMTDGKQIDFMTLDTDFSIVDEEDVVRNLLADKVLPTDVTVRYRKHGD